MNFVFLLLSLVVPLIGYGSNCADSFEIIKSPKKLIRLSQRVNPQESLVRRILVNQQGQENLEFNGRIAELLGTPQDRKAQESALQRMVEREVIPPKGVSHYISSLERQTHPIQIRYVEVFDVRHKQSPLGTPLSILRNFENEVDIVEGSARELKRESILFSVSGQMPARFGQIGMPDSIKHHREVSLPWEKDFPEIARSVFSRDRYPLVWQFTRAAGIDINLQILSELAYLELLFWGGSLEQAFITVHSTDPRTTKLYKSSRYGFNEMGRNENGSILIAPLEKLLSRFSDDKPFFASQPESDSPIFSSQHLFKKAKSRSLRKIHLVPVQDQLALPEIHIKDYGPLHRSRTLEERGKIFDKLYSEFPKSDPSTLQAAFEEIESQPNVFFRLERYSDESMAPYTEKDALQGMLRFYLHELERNKINSVPTVFQDTNFWTMLKPNDDVVEQYKELGFMVLSESFANGTRPLILVDKQGNRRILLYAQARNIIQHLDRKTVENEIYIESLVTHYENFLLSL